MVPIMIHNALDMNQGGMLSLAYQEYMFVMSQDVERIVYLWQSRHEIWDIDPPSYVMLRDLHEWVPTIFRQTNQIMYIDYCY